MSAPPDREILLAEYGKAQDSAEHHDGLVWNVTSLNWVASTVLFGFVLSGLDSQHPHKLVLVALSVVGLVLGLLVWWWAIQFGEYKRRKYRRCAEIEELLGMEQHRRLKKERLPWWMQPWQKYSYALLMVLWSGTWVIVLVEVIRA